MIGADYARGPLVAGLSLAYSRGLGEYAGVAGGQVASSVMGLYPWLGYQATDRLAVWGVAGYGAGGLRLTPAGGPALQSDLSMALAAVGTRGELIESGGADGFALAVKADALWVGTAINGVDSPAGRLAATDATVTRLRTGLEGSRGVTFGRGLSLTPRVEVGLRHDGGAAETGSGLDLGGGLLLVDPSTGLSADVRVRMLLVHEAAGFRDRGMSVSLSYNPTPSTPLGLTARVAPSWGGRGLTPGPGRGHPAVAASSSVATRSPAAADHDRNRDTSPSPGRWPAPSGTARSGAAAWGAARCSTSASPATGGRPTVEMNAARPRNGGPPTRSISGVQKAGSITVTTNGPTGHGVACGA